MTYSKPLFCIKRRKKMVGENGLKNGPIENGPIQWYCLWSTSLGPIYLRDLYSYGVLRTIVLVLETPLANKLFVNTRCQPWRPAAWPVPSPVARGHPNPAHRHHPHTMGEYACAWIGRTPITARIVGSVERAKKMLLFWRAADV